MNSQPTGSHFCVPSADVLGRELHPSQMPSLAATILFFFLPWFYSFMNPNSHTLCIAFELFIVGLDSPIPVMNSLFWRREDSSDWLCNYDAYCCTVYTMKRKSKVCHPIQDPNFWQHIEATTMGFSLLLQAHQWTVMSQFFLHYKVGMTKRPYATFRCGCKTLRHFHRRDAQNTVQLQGSTQVRWSRGNAGTGQLWTPLDYGHSAVPVARNADTVILENNTDEPRCNEHRYKGSSVITNEQRVWMTCVLFQWESYLWNKPSKARFLASLVIGM